MNKNSNNSYKDTYSMFISEIRKNKYNRLNEDEIQKIYEEYQETGNMEKLHPFIISHLHYLLKYCILDISKEKKSKFAGELMDLVQEGFLGMMEAIKRYDPEKSKFLTYATHWIKAYTNDIIFDTFNVSQLNMKDNGLNLVGKAMRIIEESKNELGYSLDINSVADILGVEPITLQLKIESTRTKGLDDPILGEENGPQLSNVIADDTIFDEEYDKELYEIILQEMKENLTQQEYDIIKMRYLDNKTLEYIGGIYGITRERIRQKEEKALSKVLIVLSEKYRHLNIDLNTPVITTSSKVNTAEKIRILSHELKRKQIKKQRQWKQDQKDIYLSMQKEISKINNLNFSSDEFHRICLHYLGEDCIEISIDKVYDFLCQDSLTNGDLNETNYKNIKGNFEKEKSYFLNYLQEKLKSIPGDYDFIVEYYTIQDKNQLVSKYNMQDIEELVGKKDQILDGITLLVEKSIQLDN